MILNVDAIAADLKREEGYERHAYKDSLGFITVAHGRCLEPGVGYGIDEEEADYLLRRDIDRVAAECQRNFNFWNDASNNVRETLIQLCFQMGTGNLLKFRKTLRHIEKQQFDLAAAELLRSKYASQTPARAQRMAERLRQG
jgi:lysozyme